MTTSAPGTLFPFEAGTIESVVVGRIASIQEDGRVLVRLAEADAPVIARHVSTVDPSALRQAADAGEGVLLVLEDGDPGRPIIVGVVRSRLASPPGEPAASLTSPERPAEAVVEGKRVVLTAEEEIVLRCGQASITLTRAGKVLIRGAYLLSRSSGVNRIKGGSVQIN